MSDYSNTDYSNYDSIVPLPCYNITVSDVKYRHRKSQQRHLYKISIYITSNRIIQSINSLHNPYLYKPLHYNTTNTSLSTYSRLYNIDKLFFTNYTHNTTNYTITNRQHKVIEYIKTLATRHVILCRQVSSSISLLLSQQDGIHDVSYTYHIDQHIYINTTDYKMTTLARPIDSKRISLPNIGNKGVNMLDLLPDHIVSIWDKPSTYTLRCNNINSTIQRPGKIYGSYNEYIKLIRRMYESGMITFVHSSNVRCINGIFCVDKSDGTLRCIIDARNANSMFVDPINVILPNPTHISRLYIHQDKPLYTCKLDLSNFYHHIHLPQWVINYMALPSVSIKDIDSTLLTIYGDITLHPCCNTMPMGFSHAVYLAQQIHQYVLYNMSNTITIQQQYNILNIQQPDISTLDQPVHLLYIDDNVAFSNDIDKLQLYYDTCIAAYKQAGLEVKVNKTTPPTQDAVNVLGILVGGNVSGNTNDNSMIGSGHYIRPDPYKLYKLLSSTMHVLDTGYSTPHDMRVLLGHWNWYCMLCRPALSIINNLYHYCNKSTYARHKIPLVCQRELLQLIGIAPLLLCNISRLYSDTIWATDASMLGSGIVRLQLNNIDYKNIIWLQSTIKQHDNRTDSMRHLLNKLATLQWTTIVSTRWRYNTSHINVLELQSVYTLIKHILSYSNNNTSTRYLILTDSTVTYYALRKGRTSSHYLQRVLSKLSALVLASGISIIPVWVETSNNPADKPSRNI